MLRVMGAGGGTGVGLDEVTQGAKPSVPGEGECSGQADLPGTAKRELTPSRAFQRQDPHGEQTGFKVPQKLGDETGPPRGWDGVGEAGALDEAHPGGSRTQWDAGCPWRHTPAPQSGAPSG